jgi:hypothetical protein
MAKRAPEPEGFVPIEHTPFQDRTDIEQPEWQPIEVTPYVPAAPVAEHTEPATGNTEGN